MRQSSLQFILSRVRPQSFPFVFLRKLSASNTILAATPIYFMISDWLMLLMSVYKLVVGVKGSRL